MGVLKEIVDIIEVLRAEGKSENEISGIIKEAAGKATVKNPEIGKITKIETVKQTKTLKEAFSEYGISAADAKRAFEQINQVSERKNPESDK